MSEQRKIVEANIGRMPKSFLDMMPRVTVTFDDGSIKELFSYYPDEIRFTSSEFIGLTEEEAIHLKFKKDKNFLQS